MKFLPHVYSFHSSDRALKGPIHQMKLYPVNYFCMIRKVLFLTKFRFLLLNMFAVFAEHRGSSDVEVIHNQFVWAFKLQ